MRKQNKEKKQQVSLNKIVNWQNQLNTIKILNTQLAVATQNKKDLYDDLKKDFTEQQINTFKRSNYTIQEIEQEANVFVVLEDEYPPLKVKGDINRDSENTRGGEANQKRLLNSFKVAIEKETKGKCLLLNDEAVDRITKILNEITPDKLLSALEMITKINATFKGKLFYESGVVQTEDFILLDLPKGYVIDENGTNLKKGIMLLTKGK